MKHIKKILLVFVSIAVLFPVVSLLHAEVPQNDDTLYQYSTIGALQAGVYDGDITIGDLNSKGDFGIGTFNALNGEMIILEGTCYQIKDDGLVYLGDRTKFVPFAMITAFSADKVISDSGEQSRKQLEDFIDSKISSPNNICAVKVHGLFKTIKTRSVPKQSKPYIGLNEVLKTQPEFISENIPGTLVGFRMPAAFDGVNKAGYHFHFIADSKNNGGHALDFVVESADIEVDETPDYYLQLPQSDDFLKAKLGEQEYETQLNTPNTIAEPTVPQQQTTQP